jgi:hypothetical protein
MWIIDEELTRDQFAELDAPTTARLVAAVEDDFGTWASRLAGAAADDDAETLRRARHALAGLCGAFGANILQQASSGPLGTVQDRDAMLATARATVAAIHDTALGPEAG